MPRCTILLALFALGLAACTGGGTDNVDEGPVEDSAEVVDEAAEEAAEAVEATAEEAEEALDDDTEQ